MVIFLFIKDDENGKIWLEINKLDTEILLRDVFAIWSGIQ